MSFYQLQTIRGSNFEDKFLLNRVQHMSFLEGKLIVQFKNSTSEQYTVSKEKASSILESWETWCSEQSSNGPSLGVEKAVEELGETFEKVMVQVDREFKDALNARVNQTLGHVDQLFSSLAPRYEALETIAKTFEKYLKAE